jgi:hypothetical protein
MEPELQDTLRYASNASAGLLGTLRGLPHEYALAVVRDLLTGARDQAAEPTSTVLEAVRAELVDTAGTTEGLPALPTLPVF